MHGFPSLFLAFGLQLKRLHRRSGDQREMTDHPLLCAEAKKTAGISTSFIQTTYIALLKEKVLLRGAPSPTIKEFQMLVKGAVSSFNEHADLKES